MRVARRRFDRRRPLNPPAGQRSSRRLAEPAGDLPVQDLCLTLPGPLLDQLIKSLLKSVNPPVFVAGPPAAWPCPPVRGCVPGAVAVVENQIDELRERIPCAEVLSAHYSLKRQRRVSGRPKGHEPLGGALELDQDHDPPDLRLRVASHQGR